MGGMGGIGAVTPGGMPGMGMGGMPGMGVGGMPGRAWAACRAWAASAWAATRRCPRRPRRHRRGREAVVRRSPGARALARAAHAVGRVVVARARVRDVRYRTPRRDPRGRFPGGAQRHRPRARPGARAAAAPLRQARQRHARLPRLLPLRRDGLVDLAFVTAIAEKLDEQARQGLDVVWRSTSPTRPARACLGARVPRGARPAAHRAADAGAHLALRAGRQPGPRCATSWAAQARADREPRLPPRRRAARRRRGLRRLAHRRGGRRGAQSVWSHSRAWYDGPRPSSGASLTTCTRRSRRTSRSTTSAVRDRARGPRIHGGVGGLIRRRPRRRCLDAAPSRADTIGRPHRLRWDTTITRAAGAAAVAQLDAPPRFDSDLRDGLGSLVDQTGSAPTSPQPPVRNVGQPHAAQQKGDLPQSTRSAAEARGMWVCASATPRTRSARLSASSARHGTRGARFHGRERVPPARSSTRSSRPRARCGTKLHGAAPELDRGGSRGPVRPVSGGRGRADDGGG